MTDEPIEPPETSVKMTGPDGETIFEGTDTEFTEAIEQLAQNVSAAIGHNSDGAASDSESPVAGAVLRSFVERFERLESEKKDIADAQKEVMAEAKGRGFDTKVLRRLIAIRKRDANDLAEEEAILELYRTAMGM